MKLESGREVELKGLTKTQWMKAFDTQGDMTQMHTFAAFALGLVGPQSFEDEDYTLEEIGEISKAAFEGVYQGKNPTIKG